MAILKSEQIMSDSKKSWDDAVEKAVTRFSKTVRNVRSANVNNFSCVVEEGEIKRWRVNLQISFEVE